MIVGVGIREFRVPDAKVWYSGSEKATEQIKISGKVTEPIKVHVSIQCSLSNGVVWIATSRVHVKVISEGVIYSRCNWIRKHLVDSGLVSLQTSFFFQYREEAPEILTNSGYRAVEMEKK